MDKVFRRGDVWYHNPRNDAPGHLQKSARPVVIVSNDVANEKSPVLLVAPLTTRQKKPLPTHVEFYVGGCYNLVLAEQAGPVNKADLDNFRYKLNDIAMDRVDAALKIAFGLDTNFNARIVVPERSPVYGSC